MCQYMKVSTSGYYAWRNREQSARGQQDLELVAAIKRVHRGDKRCYGSPRVHRELREKGYGCGRHRVARLMRLNGIVAGRIERYQNRGARDDLYARFDNLLLRREAATRPDELWVGDYTYLRTPHGWLLPSRGARPVFTTRDRLVIQPPTHRSAHTRSPAHGT